MTIGELKKIVAALPDDVDDDTVVACDGCCGLVLFNDLRPAEKEPYWFGPAASRLRSPGERDFLKGKWIFV